MKNLIFTLSLLFSTVGFGQDYIPIFEGYDSVRWNNVFSWHAMFDPVWGAFTRIATLDSIIVDDGKSYRLYKYIDDNEILRGKEILFREDTQAQKIYSKMEGDFQEFLVYDFSIEVGDTFLLNPLLNGYFEFFPCFGQVISVKNEFIFGKNRKIIELDFGRGFDFHWDCPYKTFWIEGIGTRYGFDYFNSWYNTPDTPSIQTHCIFKDDNHIFMEDRCRIDTIIDLTSIENIHLGNKVNISPNPTDNQLVIKNTSSNFLSGKIKITNLSGQLLFEKAVRFQDEIGIEEVEKLRAGIYFISLETNWGYTVRKFIKN